MTDTQESQAGREPAGDGTAAHVRLAGTAGVGWSVMALAALAGRGVLAELARGRRSVDALARRCDCDAGTLLRFLRAAVVTGAVTEAEPGTFEATELGRSALPGSPGSAEGMLRLSLTPEFLLPWSAAEQVLRTGRSGFEAVFGSPFYDYLKERPELAGLFQEAMRTTSSAPALLAAYDFPATGTVADIGGGQGAVLAELLACHRGLTGVLVDLPNVVEGAAACLARAGIADRVTVVPGSFFAPLPEGADIYVLGRVLHNWPDADAVRILTRVRDAMSPAARLLIAEPMARPDEADAGAPPGHDLLMLVLLGGRTRTPEEMRVLLRNAGLREESSCADPRGDTVVVATRD
ncbi:MULTISPECIES: methyltransferase [Streptomyces]|uniref:Methyltransferase n=1 Tax=Streptomyces ramulosus TaxID=47762 RepID=A0ABW1FGI3_9ACTN